MPLTNMEHLLKSHQTKPTERTRRQEIYGWYFCPIREKMTDILLTRYRTEEKGEAVHMWQSLTFPSSSWQVARGIQGCLLVLPMWNSVLIAMNQTRLSFSLQLFAQRYLKIRARNESVFPNDKDRETNVTSTDFSLPKCIILLNQKSDIEFQSLPWISIIFTDTLS